jgi:hypothetical protein
MKSNATVFLTEDRKTAVAEGDPKARFLLVRAGGDIAEARYKDVAGAAELIEGKSKKTTDDKHADKKAGK